MPPVPAAQGDMVQLRIIGMQEGTETNNVLHFVAATANDDIESRLVLAYAECFVPMMIPRLSNLWRLVKIKWKRVSPTLGPEYETIPPGELVGQAAGSAYPTFVAALASIHTLQGGRSHRGRNYMAGIPESAAPNSVIPSPSDFWTDYVAFWNCVVSRFIAGDPPAGNSWQMGVYSRKLGGSTFPYGAAGFTPISQIIPSQILATMRSRKIGRGA
jgi:hypothetical protein